MTRKPGSGVRILIYRTWTTGEEESFAGLMAIFKTKVFLVVNTIFSLTCLSSTLVFLRYVSGIFFIMDVLSFSISITRTVLLLRMSGAYWRKTNRQDGVGSVRDGEQLPLNRYMLQVQTLYN